jgi:hypothetical protein
VTGAAAWITPGSPVPWVGPRGPVRMYVHEGGTMRLYGRYDHDDANPGQRTKQLSTNGTCSVVACDTRSSCSLTDGWHVEHRATGKSVSAGK